MLAPGGGNILDVFSPPERISGGSSGPVTLALVFEDYHLTIPAPVSEQFIVGVPADDKQLVGRLQAISVE